MKYLPKSRQRGGHRQKAFFLFAIFIIGALFFSFFDNLITKAVSPLWRGENWFSRTLTHTGEYFKTRSTLLEENITLKEKSASLELELSALSLSRSESERLLALLGRQVRSGGTTVSVLTQPPQSPYDLVVVDAGLREGIAIGSKVYLPEGPLVGVVTQVFPSFSRVKLLSTSGEKTSAVLERHEVPVEMEGQGGGSFKIVLPRETDAQAGDRILSGDLESSLVAVIEEVNLEPTDSFKEVLARSPANIFNVRFLTVMP